MRPKYYIGIDPDNIESGVGIVDQYSRRCFTLKMSFPQMVRWLAELKNNYGEDAQVIIEGGWLNKSNWHVLGRFMSTQKAAAIGRSAGMNHQTGILIEQMSRYFGNETMVVKPLKKCWNGTDGKITKLEAEYFMGSLPRMNQDQRDALLLAWVYAGLPVKVKPKGIKTLKEAAESFE